MFEKGCKINNYNCECKYTRYNIVHNVLGINTCTPTFYSKEEYFDASEKITKWVTWWAIYNPHTILIYTLH